MNEKTRNQNQTYITTQTARVDLDRQHRRGLPEVVYCQDKTPEQAREIFAVFASNHQVALGTRANEAHFQAVQSELPTVAYEPMSRLLLYHPDLDAGKALELLSFRDDRSAPETKTPYIAAVSAGTADEPVLREAVGTLNVFGHRVRVIHDAGVAGLQRILDQVDVLRNALVILVVAGMDGALPSVVAGLVPTPVIAVPTSVGYGASFGGLSALLAMLNNCSGGVSVVNIDNGFGAAYTASMIARKVMHYGSNDSPVPGVDR